MSADEQAVATTSQVVRFVIAEWGLDRLEYFSVRSMFEIKHEGQNLHFAQLMTIHSEVAAQLIYNL